jgi:hypothetical protein
MMLVPDETIPNTVVIYHHILTLEKVDTTVYSVQTHYSVYVTLARGTNFIKWKLLWNGSKSVVFIK